MPEQDKGPPEDQQVNEAKIAEGFVLMSALGLFTAGMVEAFTAVDIPPHIALLLIGIGAVSAYERFGLRDRSKNDANDDIFTRLYEEQESKDNDQNPTS